VVEEEQRENYREGHPQGELLVDGHAGEGVEEKEAGHSDGHRGGIVDVDGADKVALLALELEAAVGTGFVHFKRFLVQPPDAAARTAEPQPMTEHL